MIVFFFIALILQGTAVRYLSIFGAVPDLILVLTTIYAFFYDDYEGALIGTGFGILQDICYGEIAGASGLMLLLISLLLKVIQTRVYRNNKMVLFIVTAIVTALYLWGLWLLETVLIQSGMSLTAVMQRIPLSIVWNYVVLVVISHFERKHERFMI